jgi:hypothetical protein
MKEPMTDEPMFPEAELARLADGSLPAARQSELRGKVDGSPELVGALAEQQRAVTLLRALDQPAPDSLRRRLDELTGSERAARPALRRRFFALPAATVLAIAVVAVVVVVQGGTAAPTVPQTVRFALAASTMPSPSEAGSESGLLSLRAAGIAFPYWQQTVGWKTTGSRTDTLGGRRIVTVFYTDADNSRVGYSIVAGAPLAATRGTVRNVDGVRFTFSHVGSARLVTWLRAGHTCVIAGRWVTDQTLLRLVTGDAIGTLTAS